MTTILLVDDDPIILKIYQDGLGRLGARVATAADGLSAIRALRGSRPDVVVLDLMMPKFSGVDVLKFVRSEPALKDLPVVVLSNSYMNELAAEAATLGVQKALLKVRCTPSILLHTIQDAVRGVVSSDDTALLFAGDAQIPPPPGPPKPQPPPAPATPPPPPTWPPPAPADFQAQARHSFLQSAGATCAALRELCHAFTGARNPAERDVRSQALCRKVHFIAAAAGLAQCHRLAWMASALEALLFELNGQPAAATPSVLRTVAGTVDFLALLFDCARETDSEPPAAGQVLVVDDDPLSTRLVVSALQRAQLQAYSSHRPTEALKWLQERRFDLVLLDISMPEVDGYELCGRLRRLPGYAKIPVIYVTIHSDFEHRAKSLLSGGDDMITKPVFPMELAVKAVALLLKRQMAKA